MGGADGSRLGADARCVRRAALVGFVRSPNGGRTRVTMALRDRSSGAQNARGALKPTRLRTTMWIRPETAMTPTAVRRARALTAWDRR
jgi:hypothetical protein